jgi:hypothetical protein
MAADSGWFYLWTESEYFPPVWFAPGDESHLTPAELRRGPGSFYAVARPQQHGKRRRLYDHNVERDRLRRRREDEFILLGC